MTNLISFLECQADCTQILFSYLTDVELFINIRLLGRKINRNILYLQTCLKRTQTKIVIDNLFLQVISCWMEKNEFPCHTFSHLNETGQLNVLKLRQKYYGFEVGEMNKVYQATQFPSVHKFIGFELGYYRVLRSMGIKWECDMVLDK